MQVDMHPRYQKVYWITGEAGGGSVANLLAQKMIKKYGNKNIYCYTFQALNTINCNNIPSIYSISNDQYDSIFNLYNDDNQVLQIYTNEANFYMYGVRKHEAISSSRKSIEQWQNSTSVRYDITPDKYYAQNFIKMLIDKLDREMVTGFAFTETQIKKIDGYIEKIKNTYDPQKFTDLHIDLVAYFVEIGLKYDGKEFYFEDTDDHKKYIDAMAEVEKWRDINFVNSSMSSSGLSSALGNKEGDKGSGFSVGGSGQNLSEVDERDGYPFIEYKDELQNYPEKYSNNTHSALKISQFMYSNYTIDERYKERDINYVKFWNYSKNGKLSEYYAGDYSKHTVFTREGENKYLKKLKEKISNSRIRIVNGIYTIDGRIVAAFPGALRGEDTRGYKGSNNDMNKVSSYNKKFKWGSIINEKVRLQHDGDFYTGTGNAIYLTGDDIYKLVDCVFEDTNKYQFVVPFIVMDAKMIHLLPNYDSGVTHFLSNGVSREGMYSNFTDNRYGQVIEYIEDSADNPIKTYEYYEVRDKAIFNYNEGKAEKDQMYEGVIVSKEEYENLDKAKYEKYNPEHPVFYFDKLATRSVVSISPIEPNTDGSVSSDKIMQTITGSDTNNYRLISMRIYGAGAKIAYEDGEPVTNPIWLEKKRDIETATNITLNNISYSSILEYYQSDDYYNNIVDY